jgi:heavy metal translocating P-type ATPase
MTHETQRAVCDYCKLPLAAPWWDGAAGAQDQEAPVYCCLGCRLAAAILEERVDDGRSRSTLVRLGLSIFCTMNVMAFTMALWTTDVYGPTAEATGALATSLHGLFRSLALLFSLPVLYFLGFPLFRHAADALRRGILSTDWLLASGVAAAFVFSFLSVLRGAGPVYFEVGCVILVMTTLGRWLEATGKLKAGAALDALARLLPDRVRRVSGGVEQSVGRSEIQRGDVLRVLAGERIPADGHVVRGTGLVDEQVLTGETRPALKERGDRVLGGTLSLDGELTIEVRELGGDGTLTRVVEMVRRARETKGRYQRLADRVATRFVPAVFAVALGAFGAHWAVGSLDRGLWAGLAVVLVACPCALGLAAPLAVWSALGNAASQRVLFRSGETLERLSEIAAVRFDKTGTLTTGAARVAASEVENADERDLALARSAALAAASTHAMARAVTDYARNRQTEPSTHVTDLRVAPGRGVSARCALTGLPIILGSERFLREQAVEIGPGMAASLESAAARALPLSLIAWDGKARGLFLFDEEWRSSALAVMRWLAHAGLDVSILTGDCAARGQVIAQEFDVIVAAELSPEQKVAAIEQAQRAIGPVCMIGDGINDAAALSASDVGIALACGTDLSRESASICLLGDDLGCIPWTFELARRTRRAIRWNLIWAFGYNGMGVLCAALGWLNPAFAAFLMVASGSLVTVNSLRLGRPFQVDLEDHPLASSPTRARPIEGAQVSPEAGPMEVAVP